MTTYTIVTMPTLKEWIEETKKENKRLLLELRESKSKRELTSLVRKDFQRAAKTSNLHLHSLTIQLWKYTYLRKNRSFLGSMLVAERNCSSDEFWLFLTRLRLDLFERDLAFRTSSVR